MVYEFVSMKGKDIYASVFDIPYVISGFTPDFTKERNEGALVHREELDNQPMFEGWTGPMWDGGNYRYETPEVYDMLSR